MADAPVRVTQYTDPSCPWAYSAEPFLRGLEWRYGDGLEWRTVMIGLSEDTRARERAGVTPARSRARVSSESPIMTVRHSRPSP